METMMVNAHVASTIKLLEDGIRRAKSNLGKSDAYDAELVQYIEVNESLIDTCKRVLERQV